MATPANAMEGSPPGLPATAVGDINVGYTLNCAFLVFFMQVGFAMLSAGSVRAKNAKNIILLNLLDACFGCMAWYITGYAFAFGDPIPEADGSFTATGSPFIGHRFFAQAGLPRTDLVKWFFQFTFAATSATIVSGAVAERCRFESYICYNVILVAFVYPVVAHFVWSPWGWMSALRTPATASGGYTLLAGTGVYDFAGDGPVHMVGGFASLAGAWVLGPRIGRFTSEGRPVDMPGHSASLTLLGVFFLWFGWYGFNPGSTNAILQPDAATRPFVPGYSSIAAGIAVNTTISAAAATVATLLAAMLHTYATCGCVVWDLIVAGNGALAGLVAITGGCAFMPSWAAWVTGFLAGLLYYAASRFILHHLKVDDPLDAIAVHAVCGAWGMIACAAFADPELVTAWFGPPPGAPVAPDGALLQRLGGFVMGGGGALLAAHLIYIVVIAAWTLSLMVPFFMLLRKVGILRVPAHAEVAGLDVSYHGGSSYPGAEVAYVKAGPGSRLLLEEAVEEALRQVEARGWHSGPPRSSSYKASSPSSRVLADGSVRGGNAAGAAGSGEGDVVLEAPSSPTGASAATLLAPSS